MGPVGGSGRRGALSAAAAAGTSIVVVLQKSELLPAIPAAAISFSWCGVFASASFFPRPLSSFSFSAFLARWSSFSPCFPPFRPASVPLLFFFSVFLVGPGCGSTSPSSVRSLSHLTFCSAPGRLRLPGASCQLLLILVAVPRQSPILTQEYVPSICGSAVSHLLHTFQLRPPIPPLFGLLLPVQFAQ